MFCAERQFFDSPLGASYPTDIYTKFHYYRGLRKPYKSGTHSIVQNCNVRNTYLYRIDFIFSYIHVPI